METIGNKTAILFPVCSICFHSAADQPRAWHFGHSLKDLGEKDSEINSVPAAEIVRRFEELWRKAKPVT